MKVSQDKRAKTLLSSIHPSFFSMITNAMEKVHPKERLNRVEINESAFVLAMGKNALVQAKETLLTYPDKIHGIRVHQVEGYTDETIDGYEQNIVMCSHPFPSKSTFDATRETLSILGSIPNDLQVVVLISGGASAAFALPEDGIEVEQYLEILRLAIAAGYPIEDLNLIRSLIDQVKGGKLLDFLTGYQVTSWITSDVIPDDPRIVGSGPTASGIEIDPSIISWLGRLFRSLDVSKNLKDLIEKLKQVDSKDATNRLLTTRMDLVSELQQNLEGGKFDSVIVDANLEGTITEVKSQILQTVEQFNSFTDRVLIWTGEPTLTLTTSAIEEGKGGRVSALSCLVADGLEKYDNVIFIGIATDGVDATSPASGYVIDSKVAADLREFGGSETLIRNGNSGLALSSLDLGIHLDYTDINLLDLYLVIIQ